MNKVTLEDHELKVAAHVAFDRGYQSLMAGLRNVNGGNNDPFLRHVYGALGECAFAKFINAYWDGSLGRFKGMGDDVSAFQVRTRSGRLPLILRPTDKDEDIFVLVCMAGTMREWEVIGWIKGGDGKRVGRLVNMQGGQRYQVEIERLNDVEGWRA